MSDLNDPGFLFAAGPTLLAWNRTSISHVDLICTNYDKCIQSISRFQRLNN